MKNVWEVGNVNVAILQVRTGRTGRDGSSERKPLLVERTPEPEPMDEPVDEPVDDLPLPPVLTRI